LYIRRSYDDDDDDDDVDDDDDNSEARAQYKHVYNEVQRKVKTKWR